MCTVKCLLVLAMLMAVCYCQSGGGGVSNTCNSTVVDAMGEEVALFCSVDAVAIRREQHFWCGGYIDGETMEVLPGTEAVILPTDPTNFWTIFLQFPALSFMDVERKKQLFAVIADLLNEQDGCGAVDYQNFCVSNVETYKVAEYKESVIVTLYNFGENNGESLNGADIKGCFDAALRSDDMRVTRFRGKTALVLSLDGVLLDDMFTDNIGPASSIGNPDRDPTLRPIVVGNWAGSLTLREAVRNVDDGDFASNPDPINYGLEAGDIVFAIFGSLLLAVLGFLIVLGYFIHPFFLS